MTPQKAGRYLCAQEGVAKPSTFLRLIITSKAIAENSKSSSKISFKENDWEKFIKYFFPDEMYNYIISRGSQSKSYSNWFMNNDINNVSTKTHLVSLLVHEPDEKEQDIYGRHCKKTNAFIDKMIQKCKNTLKSNDLLVNYDTIKSLMIYLSEFAPAFKSSIMLNSYMDEVFKTEMEAHIKFNVAKATEFIRSEGMVKSRDLNNEFKKRYIKKLSSSKTSAEMSTEERIAQYEDYQGEVQLREQDWEKAKNMYPHDYLLAHESNFPWGEIEFQETRFRIIIGNTYHTTFLKKLSKNNISSDEIIEIFARFLLMITLGEILVCGDEIAKEFYADDILNLLWTEADIDSANNKSPRLLYEKSKRCSNTTDAFEFLHLAADLCEKSPLTEATDIWYELGQRYEFGNGCTEDLVKAAECYKKSLMFGDNINASFKLYEFYEEGKGGCCKDIEEAKNNLLSSSQKGNENAIVALAEAYFLGNENLLLAKDIDNALAVLENGFKNNHIHKLKGRCRYLLGKIYYEKSKTETDGKTVESFKTLAENNFKLAKACSYQEAIDIINKAKKEKKNKPQICDCVDFYITNGSDKANLAFVKSAGNAKEIKTDENPGWINDYKSEIKNNSHAVLAAAFFSDNTEKNISDCMQIINDLNRLNNEISGEELRRKKEEIQKSVHQIEDICNKLHGINFEGSAVITEKLETVKEAIVESNIKLGLHGVFLNIEKETAEFLNSCNSTDISLMKQVSDIKNLFALPESMKKLMESVRIYVKADPEFATSIIDTELNQLENNLYFKVKIVDYATESAHQLISEKPLFAPFIENKEQKTNLVVFGSNKVVERIVTETIACTSMGTEFSPLITVIDKEENIKAVKASVENSCIALFNDDNVYSIDKPVFISASLQDPSIPLLASNKAENYENKYLADALRWGNYFVVATDNDKFNINFAKKLRGWLLMTDDMFERTPTIAVLVKNNTTASAVSRFEVGSHTAGYSWFDDYNLFCFGEEEKVYSAYELINDPNEKRAEYIHCSYSFISENSDNENKKSFFDNDLVHESLASFYNNYYNHDSSLCTALSLPYRMYAAGKTLKDIDDYSEKQGADVLAEMTSELAYDKECLDVMAKAEHNRWVAFMISRGWRKATEKQFINYKRRGVPKQQCFICKLHPYLAEWDELDKIHSSLQKVTLNALGKTKLSNPKEYDKDSIKHTADFLNNFELTKELSKNTSEEER